MLPVLLSAAIGIAVGLFRRPLGSHLVDPVVVVPGAGLVGAALQVAAGWSGMPVSGGLLGISLAVLCGFAVVNRQLLGMGVIAVGLALNAVVVLTNGAMPVRAEALVRAGAVEVEDLARVDLGAGRRFERDSDRFVVLGDIVPVPPFDTVMSFGDLIVLMGVGSLSGDLTRYARRRLRGRQASSSRDRRRSRLFGQAEPERLIAASSVPR